MINVTEMRKGTIIEIDNDLLRVLEYQHHKSGRGNAVIRTKLRNLRTGSTVERTFNSGERVQDARLDHHTVQYLYHDGDLYYFMDTETFEQPVIKANILGDAVNYLTESISVELETYDGEPIAVDLPTTVDVKVVQADPGYAGDTANSPSKQVMVETGVKVQVPLFVNEGDVIRVDTRDGSYVTRV
jgi:elongation factor P